MRSKEFDMNDVWSRPGKPERNNEVGPDQVSLNEFDFDRYRCPRAGLHENLQFEMRLR